MSTIKVVDLISRAGEILNDAGFVRWTKPELLLWLNDGRRAVVEHRPDASAVNEPFSCDENSKQQLPAAGLRLIKVVRNSGGGAITPVDQSMLDEMVPDWHDDSAPTTEVQHYVYDDRDPKNFYLYPVPAASHSIELVYSTAPADIAVANFDTDTQVLALDDTYSNAVLDFMLHRAFSKDADHSPNAQRASLHLQAFGTALGIKTRADATVSPNNG